MGSQDGASAMERARMTAGYTLPEVAIAVSRSTSSIRRWETGATTPPRDVHVKLARMYGVAPADLVDA